MKKVLMTVGVGVVVLCIGVALFVGVGSSECYTQINNTKISEIEPEGDMIYAYTLTAYDEKGKTKHHSCDYWSERFWKDHIATLDYRGISAK